MIKPVNERVKGWRERKIKKGGKSLSVWLEPETARMLDVLLHHYGETASPLIARGIRTLYEVTCNSGDLDPIDFEEEKETVPIVCKEEDLDPLLREIRESLSRGIPMKDLKKILLEWIKDMKQQGVTFQSMANKLNEARIPTLVGKGEWQEGALATVLILNFNSL